ncbi:MAG TPA: helix-turn-helix domain-containing protein [Rubellimicrobium sp.]|jgi:DNA-binding HxlR family transcriptional regulator|nr:helix-turn-helix domain-containing protein [Rubellimicrobium sp.]
MAALIHSQPCRQVAGTLSLVGDKWSVLVIMLLSEGPCRFNELKRLIGGISQRMLTFTLRGLEREGLVTRTVFPTIPPRVEYELTDLGHSLRDPVMALGLWAIRNQPVLEAARRRFDAGRSDAGQSNAVQSDVGPGEARAAGEVP